MMSNIKGLYLHIPFCKNICYYCDFAKVYYEDKLVDEYLLALENEIRINLKKTSEIQSIYIGGGSPSSLSIKQLEKLFNLINNYEYLNLKEFTIELNPDDVDEEFICILSKNGINRVSLGVQTFNDKILKSLNRHHTNEDVIQAIDLLRKYQINNISIDLMYGFNNQTKQDIIYDLKMIKQLKLNHVAVYSLIIEQGSVFYNNKYQINQEEADYNDLINDYLLNELNFEHYEVSNYAKDQQYSKHNLLYWSNERYYGFGLGAAGYVDDYRYYNTKSITNYNKLSYNRVIEPYNSKAEYLKDEIMLSFRRYNGINLKEINLKHSIDFTSYFLNAIIKNINNIYIENDKLYFYKNGKMFLNDVIIDFMNEIEE